MDFDLPRAASPGQLGGGSIARAEYCIGSGGLDQISYSTMMIRYQGGACAALMDSMRFRSPSASDVAGMVQDIGLRDPCFEVVYIWRLAKLSEQCDDGDPSSAMRRT